MKASINLSEKLLPLVDLCESVLPLLPNNLIDEANKARIRNCALLFDPLLKTNRLLFECFLKSEKSACDFHFESTLTPELLISLRNSLSKNHWHETCHWKRLSAFFENWAVVEQHDQEQPPRIGIELDIGSNLNWPPGSNIFVELFKCEKTPTELIEAAFYLINKDKLHPKTIDILNKCENDFIKINFAGFMLGRQEKALRISCGKASTPISSENILAYLQNISHPCLDDHLIDLLNKFSPYLDIISFDFDVSTFLLPKIGINCGINKENLLATKESWDSFLEFLVSENLITDENRFELIHWIGGKKEPFYSVCDSLDGQGQTGAIYHAYLVRDINHIKFNYTPGCALQMKAYLRVKTIPLDFF